MLVIFLQLFCLGVGCIPRGKIVSDVVVLLDSIFSIHFYPFVNDSKNICPGWLGVSFWTASYRLCLD